jgi:hypothetical protein
MLQVSVDVMQLLLEDPLTNLLMSLVCRGYSRPPLEKVFDSTSPAWWNMGRFDGSVKFKPIGECGSNSPLDPLADAVVSYCNIDLIEELNVGFLFYRATRRGRIDLLERLLQSGKELPQEIFQTAAASGDVDTVKWCRDNGLAWSVLVCAAAASSGSLTLLKWCRQQGCPWNQLTLCEAAIVGNLEMMQWCWANNCPNYPNSAKVCRVAIEMGHLEIVKWYASINPRWKDERICRLAAEHGHLDILQWARANGCTWTKNTCADAAYNNHFDVLRWARSNGCPWSKSTCTGAAHAGNLEMLQWARAQGCPWDNWTCVGAVCVGNLEMLQWARANGCPWVVQQILCYVDTTTNMQLRDWVLQQLQ